jgi:hypothetical protein
MKRELVNPVGKVAKPEAVSSAGAAREEAASGARLRRALENASARGR